MKKEKQLLKIVYFDEGAATDFIYIFEGGKSEDRKENIISKTNDLETKTEAKVNGSTKFFNFFKAEGSAEGSVAFNREGITVIKRALESTILTDYIELSEDKAKKYVDIFNDKRLFPYPESFAYYKMLTPFLAMTEGTVDAGEFKLSLAKMDQALIGGRGYYELMTTEKDKQIVLRFNIKAFRNNYSISDLVKMNLTFHAIEVGTIKLNQLSMESEFSNEEMQSISGYDLFDEAKGGTSDTYCKVYDVILAGVYK